jgi:hypothetical protein
MVKASASAENMLLRSPPLRSYSSHVLKAIFDAIASPPLYGVKVGKQHLLQRLWLPGFPQSVLFQSDHASE